MSLKVAGIPLPLAAVGAAGAGWLLGHLSSRQESAAIAGAPAAPAPPATIDNPSASLDFGQDLGPGVLPGVSPWNGGGGYVGGGGDGDFGGGYGGDPVPITGGPAPTPVPVTTAPPAPTVQYWARPSSSVPSGAVGWVHLPPPSTVYDASSVPSTGAIPLRTARALEAAGSRWVKGTRTGKLPSGALITVRQFSRVNLADWSLQNFIKDGTTPVYPLSTAKVAK